jgi:hypothetical protein
MTRTRSALLAAGVVAAVTLLPGQAAFAAGAAGTTIALTEDGERFFFFDDSVLEGDGVAVTPGSTLRVPAAPEGSSWDTGGDFVLFEDEEIIFELESVAEAVESVTSGEPAEGPVALEELDALGEIAAAEDEPGAVVGGTVEADPSVEGGVLVTLDGDVPAGRYVAGFFATGPEVGAFYFVTLTVAPGAPVEIVLDYTEALFTASSFFTTADVTVPLGGRVTLTAPPGVDLSDFEIEAFLPEDEDLAFPFYTADELDVSVAADGSSLSFTVPTVLPVQEDGAPATEPLPVGAAIELYLFRLIGDFGDGLETVDGPLDITEYVVTGLTTGAGATSTTTTTATTTPRIPTAVPAGGGTVVGGPDVSLTGAALLGGLVVVGTVAMVGAVGARGAAPGRRL